MVSDTAIDEVRIDGETGGKIPGLAESAGLEPRDVVRIAVEYFIQELESDRLLVDIDTV